MTAAATRQTGWVHDVSDVPLGSALIAAAGIGATTLSVADAGEFNSTGGEILLNGDVLGYTTVNYLTDVVTLAVPLAAAAAIDDAVQLWQSSLTGGVGAVKVNTIALVEFANRTGDVDLIPAAVDSGIIDALPKGPRGSRGETVILEQYQSTWRVIDIQGVQLSRDGGYIDVGTLPDPTIPTEPPASSPTLKVTGSAEGFIIEAVGNVEPSTTLEYHVSATSGFTPGPTTLAATTRATVFYLTRLPDGSLPLADTPYYFRAVATNVAGAAAPSPEVGQLLDPSAMTEVIAARLVAGFILTGSIQVGQMTIDADDGITIPQPDGGSIHFPVNGDAATVTAHIVARSLTVEDQFTIQGLGALIGTMTIGNGISAPLAAPTVSTARVVGALEDPETTSLGGACLDSSGNWIAIDGSGNAYRYDSSNTIVATAAITARQAPAGLARIGSTMYALYRGTYGLTGATWGIVRFNESTLASAGADFDLTSALGTDTHGWLGHDGTNLQVVKNNPNTGILSVQAFLTATGAQTGATLALGTGSGITFPKGILTTAADFGATRMVIIGDAGSSTTLVRCYTTAGVRQAGNEWDPGAMVDGHGARRAGVVWDGTRFWFPRNTWKGDKYAARPVAQTVDASYSWYDGNATGGTHETEDSPLATYVVPARAHINVTVPAAPEEGSVTQDAANQARIYIGPTATPASLRLQATPAIGVRNAIVSELNGASKNPESTNGFTGVAGAQIGKIASEALVGGEPPIRLEGDGSGRVGPIEWNASGHEAHSYKVASSGTVCATSGQWYKALNLVDAYTDSTSDMSFVGGATSEWTVDVAGRYIASARSSFPVGGAAGHARGVRIIKDAAQVDGTLAPALGANSSGAAIVVEFFADVGDVLTVEIFQASGGSLTSNGVVVSFRRVGA